MRFLAPRPKKNGVFGAPPEKKIRVLAPRPKKNEVFAGRRPPARKKVRFEAAAGCLKNVF